MAQINWHKIILHDNSINLFNFFLQLWCIFHQTGDEKGDKLTDWGCNNCLNDYFMFYHQTQETECDHLDNGILGCVSKPQRQKMFSITVHSNLHCSIGNLSKAITVRSFLLFTAFWVPPLKAIWKLVIFPQTMCYSLLGRCQQVFNLCWTSCSKCLLFIIEQIVYTMELVYEYISNIIDNVIPILHHSVFWF